VGCSYSPNPIPPPSGGSASSTLTLSVGSGVAPGTYSFSARGTSGSLVHTFGITLTVTSGGTGDFSLTCSPSSYSIPQGSSSTGTCTVTSTPPFSSPVTLDCTGQPSGVTCSYSPNPITPSSGGSASAFITIGVGAGVPTGTYSFSARGTSGSLVHTFAISLTVTGPGGGGDFSISCSPNFFTAHPPATRTSTCTVQSFAPFNSPVALSCVVPWPTLSCSFSPNPVTPPSGGAITSTMTLTVGAGTPQGFYAFSAQGQSGSMVRAAQMFLFVN
jgi:hypothetical protein